VRMLSTAAQQTIQDAVHMTDEQWNKGDFQSILTVASQIPGLAEALLAIFNGAGNNGHDWPAIIKAIPHQTTIHQAQPELEAIANKARTAVITVAYINAGNPIAGGNEVPIPNAIGNIWKNNAIQHFANGGFSAKHYAGGGFENHVAQISRRGGPVRIWGEPETQGEAYLPLANSKRPRSVKILKEVARHFGYEVS